MADLVMGAMGSLIRKLYQLLEKEYSLQTRVKERISSVTQELEHAQAALRKVAQVPWDQLDEQVQIWARQVREASYDMEDVLDTFLVRVQGPDSAEQERSFLKSLKKMGNLFRKSKARRKISGDVMDIMTHLQEVTERCRRYKVDDIVARQTTTSTVDPRIHAMYTRVDKLVGIDESSGELKGMLQLDNMSNTKMKTVSIVGIGGLGKTTLAKAVYDNLRGDFDCSAFVSVGRNPDLQKVLQMILISLDRETYGKFNFAVLQDITQFIDELREFLHDNKRYFIVIDDLWEKNSWETLKLAITDIKNSEGRIIITTRKWEVAKNADEVYKLPPLPNDSSKKLFYTRIYGDERKYVYYQPDKISEEILRKCEGIPLAIITMASLLVDEPRDRWFELYKSVGFGCKENEESENIIKKILSFSYYDLPSHLRTCLLYLSAFPEDSVVAKFSLVWMWAAEGFVQRQKGKGLFEIGEGYFNDLTNRSLIQEVDPDYYGSYSHGIHGCRVHDMVLDFIRSMSHQENFIVVFDNNDQVTDVRSNVVRRLANHNKTLVLSNPANMLDMSKMRSFIASDWTMDTWAQVSSFKLLRVLNIIYYGTNYNNFNLVIGRRIRIDHIRHLHHLRFLGISATRIEKIPEEIGSLKMLQTLDLSSSSILELPSSSSFPTQLVCLRIAFDSSVHDANMFSVGSPTSLEDLYIGFDRSTKAPRRLVKELGSLRELRVLNARIHLEDDEMEKDLVESVSHLHKLQHLEFRTGRSWCFDSRPEMEFVLRGNLRHLVLPDDLLCKLPSCIDPLCHRKISHLDLTLLHMEDQELKTLGRLPELRFLGLNLPYSSPIIHNISDSDACYFRKLRCLKLKSSSVLFVASKGDDGKKTVSFQIWDRIVDEGITMPPTVSDSELQGNDDFSSVSQWEMSKCRVREKNDKDLQLLSASDDVDPSKLQHRTAVPLVSDEGDRESAETPRFMPCLQVLHIQVREQAILYNLRLEIFSSLREIRAIIDLPFWRPRQEVDLVKAALRHAAGVHPNQPTLRFD